MLQKARQMNVVNDYFHQFQYREERRTKTICLTCRRSSPEDVFGGLKIEYRENENNESVA